MTSKHEGIGLSNLIRKVVEDWLETRRLEQLAHTYEGLDRFRGKGKAGITNASTTIDATLYGDDGGWKGHDE
jgi:hypothetical protein